MQLGGVDRVGLVKGKGGRPVLRQIDLDDRVPENRGAVGLARGRQRLVHGVGDAAGNLLAPRERPPLVHDLFSLLAVEQVRRLVARRVALRKDEEIGAVPAVQLGAHVVPEIGRDLVEVLRLLRGAGHVDNQARELPVRPPEAEEIDGMILAGLDAQ